MDEGSECIISSAATPQYSELQKTCRPSGRCLLRLGRADQSEQSWLLGWGGNQTSVFRQRVSTGAVHIKHVNRLELKIILDFLTK